MKKLGFALLGALLVIVLFTLTGFGTSTMDAYTNEKDSGQTLTVLADKASMHSLVVSIFTEPQGYYFLQTSGIPEKGRSTKGGGGLHLKRSDGKARTLTIQPDSSLRDENGVTWRLQSHSESSMTVAKNRAACLDKLGKNCPY